MSEREPSRDIQDLWQWVARLEQKERTDTEDLFSALKLLGMRIAALERAASPAVEPVDDPVCACHHKQSMHNRGMRCQHHEDDGSKWGRDCPCQQFVPAPPAQAGTKTTCGCSGDCDGSCQEAEDLMFERIGGPSAQASDEGETNRPCPLCGNMLGAEHFARITAAPSQGTDDRAMFARIYDLIVAQYSGGLTPPQQVAVDANRLLELAAGGVVVADDDRPALARLHRYLSTNSFIEGYGRGVFGVPDDRKAILDRDVAVLGRVVQRD